MQPSVLDLNLATRPFRNNTLLWIGYALGVVAVLALTVWNVHTYTSSTRAISGLRAEMANFDQEVSDLRQRHDVARRGIRNHDIGFLRTQASRANDVIQMKAFSWTRLFNGLEEVMPYEVRMQSVQPIFRVGQRSRYRATEEDPLRNGIPVNVEGVAKNLEGFLEFERNLFDHPRFDRVEPERTDLLPNQEWAFKIRFNYFPEGRADGDLADADTEVAEVEVPASDEDAVEATDDDVEPPAAAEDS